MTFFLQLSLGSSLISFFSATFCSKVICHGCNHATQIREIKDSLTQRCLFCRKALPKTKKEGLTNEGGTIEVSYPVALSHLGVAAVRQIPERVLSDLGDRGRHQPPTRHLLG
mmetsp:Transcript_13308/g.21843  ORF Transcript_13308/g.21843 Transcript_13308/m.21843 type:complete len:112 (-) Transcript_13308:323-658(-)